MTHNSDFDLFRVSEDHDAIREAVRAIAENKIAPYAAEVDRTASFPTAAHDALVASDFHAPHVPEEYGGVGADAIASAIVVEEIARVCASSSLIPGANKLGSTPLILAGSEDLKQKYLRPLAEGATTFSYALSEREAGSDAASMRTRATADGDDWVLNGQKSWITNAGVSDYYTVLAVTDPEGGAARTSAPLSSRRRTPGSPSARRSASSASRARPPVSCSSTTCASRATG